MGLIEIFLDGMLAFYVIAGSTSLGYVFLRLGWPDVRALDKQYKAGWSIVIGLVFSAIVVIASLAFSLNPFYKFEFREALLLNLAITFIAATLLLTLKRKFLVRNKMTVSMPSTLLGAKVTAKKVVEQLEKDPGFIRASGFEGNKIDELKKRLGKDEEGSGAVEAEKSGIVAASQIKELGTKPGKFAAQEKQEVLKIQEPLKKPQEQKLAEKILPAEKPLQPEKTMWPEKPAETFKIRPEQQASRPEKNGGLGRIQPEQQANKPDKIDELRRMLDERLSKRNEESAQKPAAFRLFENKQKVVAPEAGQIEKLKKISEAKPKEENAAIGWLPKEEGKNLNAEKWPPQKPEPITRQKPKVEEDLKTEEKKHEEKLREEVKPAALEGENEDNVLERLLEEKQKEIEKLKKIRKGK